MSSSPGRGEAAETSGPASEDQGSAEAKRGAGYAFAAYGMWGLFPLYFVALRPAGAWEILAHRILWTLVFCLLVLAVRRDLGWMRRLVDRPRLTAGIALAAALIAVNWTVYVAAVLAGRTHEAALGYFLNPLVTVALGVLVLRERLRPLQWAAIGVGALAAVYLIVTGDGFPWAATALALSFGSYGLVKKKVGGSLDALHSLTAETLVLLPVAAAVIAVIGTRGEATFAREGTGHLLIMISAGIVTAIPLLLFAAAARRAPLVTIGLIQFMTPVMQLLIGVFALHEHMSTARWVGFVIVWVALAILMYDSVTAWRASLRVRQPSTRSR